MGPTIGSAAVGALHERPLSHESAKNGRSQTAPTAEELERVVREFREILDQREDIGAAKIIGAWFFAPCNIFDPNSRRKPKPEILIAVLYVLLMTAACGVFNLL